MDYIHFGPFAAIVFSIITVLSQFQVSSSQMIDIGPQNKTVKLGSNVVLECVFQTPVTCMWGRVHGVPVKIAERYRFIKRNGTRDAMDCSIGITNLQESDLGPWECKTDSFTAAIAWISEQKTPSQPKIFFMGKELTELVVPLSVNQASASNLTCVSEMGNPLPKLFWELDGRKIPGKIENIANIESKWSITYLSWTQGDWCSFYHKGPLRCILEHPGYEQPQAATVNFVELKVKTPVLNNSTTFTLIGLLLLMVLIFTCILKLYIYCKKIVKTKRIPEYSVAATFTSQCQSDPYPEVHIYNYISTETRRPEENSGEYLVPLAVNPLLHFYDPIRA